MRIICCLRSICLLSLIICRAPQADAASVILPHYLDLSMYAGFGVRGGATPQFGPSTLRGDGLVTLADPPPLGETEHASYAASLLFSGAFNTNQPVVIECVDPVWRVVPAGAPGTFEYHLSCALQVNANNELLINNDHPVALDLSAIGGDSRPLTDALASADPGSFSATFSLPGSLMFTPPGGGFDFVQFNDGATLTLTIPEPTSAWLSLTVMLAVFRRARR